MADKYTVTQLKKALDKWEGNVTLAAKDLNVCRKTFHNYLNKYPTLKALQEEHNKSFEGELRDKFKEKVRSGDVTSMIWYSKSQCGWSEVKENPIKPDANIIDRPIIVEKVVNG